MRLAPLTAAFAVMLLSTATAATAQPSPLSASPQGGPSPDDVRSLASAVGYSMGSTPEMQRRCAHTAEQKRRAGRVIAYLEAQFLEKGGAPARAAFRQGSDAANAQAVELVARMPAAELRAACQQMAGDFELKLKKAESGIPLTFMPPTPVKPAAVSTTRPAPAR